MQVFLLLEIISTHLKKTCSAGVCCALSQCIRQAVVLLLNMVLRAFLSEVGSQHDISVLSAPLGPKKPLKEGYREANEPR